MKALSRLLLVAVLIVSSALVALAQATVTKSSFGKTAAGENVDLYALRNVNGMETKITNFGGIVQSFGDNRITGNGTDGAPTATANKL